MKYHSKQRATFLLCFFVNKVQAFQCIPTILTVVYRQQTTIVEKQQSRVVLFSDPYNEMDSLLSTTGNIKGSINDSETKSTTTTTAVVAATGTVNERLLAELQEATDKEKYGTRSALGKKLGLDAFKSEKTDAERAASVAAARDLNGVNPLVALAGSAVALGGAAGLWWLTNWLGAFFAFHPVDTDVYFIQRASLVFRNVVMGLASLASGFFGVTGLGIFLLGVRVAYGVAIGELDPTPIKNNKSTKELEMPNVLDLMMGKKPGRGNK